MSTRLTRQVKDIMATHDVSVITMALIVFAIVLLAGLTSRLFRALTSSLHDVPGPFLARFTRYWYFRAIQTGKFEQINQELHKIHGPVVRIAPNQYSLNDPEAVNIIYAHNSRFIKSEWYFASGNAFAKMHDLFTDTDPKRHGINRRKVAALYSMTSLVQMESNVTNCTKQVLAKFESLAKTGEEFNLQEWLQFYAFDLICLLTLSEQFGFLEQGQDVDGLIAALHDYLIYASHVGVYSEWHRTFSRILSRLPKSGFGYLTDFTSRQIGLAQARSVSNEKGPVSDTGDDFLTKCLKLHTQDPAKFNMDEVFMTCLTNIGAGSDTTSVSLSGIMYHLISNPEKLQKLRDELDATAENNNSSLDHISFRESQNLPYLQACVKEGLRLHPATGLPLMRVVPKGGATLCGQNFPEGSVVGVNTWVIHRNKDIFGADAEEYRPERWLESKESASQIERYFMTFGGGARTCIGKNISLLEISKLIPELIRRFNFTLVPPCDEKLEMENVWFVKQKNLICRVKLRSQI